MLEAFALGVTYVHEDLEYSTVGMSGKVGSQGLRGARAEIHYIHNGGSFPLTAHSAGTGCARGALQYTSQNGLVCKRGHNEDSSGATVAGAGGHHRMLQKASALKHVLVAAT